MAGEAGKCEVLRCLLLLWTFDALNFFFDILRAPQGFVMEGNVHASKLFHHWTAVLCK